MAGTGTRRKKRRRKRMRSDTQLREEDSSSSDERESDQSVQESPAKEHSVTLLPVRSVIKTDFILFF